MIEHCEKSVKLCLKYAKKTIDLRIPYREVFLGTEGIIACYINTLAQMIHMNYIGYDIYGEICRCLENNLEEIKRLFPSEKEDVYSGY